MLIQVHLYIFPTIIFKNTGCKLDLRFKVHLFLFIFLTGFIFLLIYLNFFSIVVDYILKIRLINVCVFLIFLMMESKSVYKSENKEKGTFNFY